MYFNNKPTLTDHPVSLNWCSKCTSQPVTLSSQICENHLGSSFDALSVSEDNARDLPKPDFEYLAKFNVEQELCFDSNPEQKDDIKLTTTEFSDIVFTDDDHLILCSSGSRVIQNRRARNSETRFSQKLLKYSEKGKYVSQCHLDGPPRKICLLQSGKEAVVTLGQKIQFVSLLDMSPMKSVTIGSDCTGVALVNRMIYVGDSSKIHVLDQIGRHYRTIDSPCTPSNIRRNLDGRLYCTTGSALWCITPEGSLVYSYNATDLGPANAVAPDSKGNIYVGGSELQMFHPYRAKVERILLKEDGNGTIKALCFNNDFTKMFISNNEGKSISVYTCKYK